VDDNNNNNNTGMNMDDLNSVPPVSNDYNSLQPAPAVDMNSMQTPGVTPTPVEEEVDLNSIPGITDAPVVESPQPTVESITPDTMETVAPVESITPDTIDMNTVSSTPLESNVVPEQMPVEMPSTPPVASMESTPPTSDLSQNLSQPLPSVAPTADVLPTEASMDVINTLEEQPEKGKGGSAIVIVLIVIIVALLATIGYFAIQIFF